MISPHTVSSDAYTESIENCRKKNCEKYEGETASVCRQLCRDTMRECDMFETFDFCEKQLNKGNGTTDFTDDGLPKDFICKNVCGLGLDSGWIAFLIVVPILVVIAVVAIVIILVYFLVIKKKQSSAPAPQEVQMQG